MWWKKRTSQTKFTGCYGGFEIDKTNVRAAFFELIDGEYEFGILKRNGLDYNNMNMLCCLLLLVRN